MVAVKCKDNRLIAVISNHDTVVPLQASTRYMCELKKQGPVPQHQLIKNYNCDMGSVDFVDRSISELRPMIHWREFYGPLIVNAFGLLRISKLSWTPRETWLSTYLESLFLNHALVQPPSPCQPEVSTNLFKLFREDAPVSTERTTTV